jgi:formylmethanofuran dehydrogenase subunit E
MDDAIEDLSIPDCDRCDEKALFGWENEDGEVVCLDCVGDE